jgi:HK97 family phage major capsid protein
MPKSDELQKRAVELLDQARAAYDKAEKLATDEKRDITEEEAQTYRGLLAEHEKARNQAKDIRAIEDAEAWAKTGERKSSPDLINSNPGTESRAVTDEGLGRALRAWGLAKFKRSEVTDADFEAAKRIGIHPDDREISIRFGSIESLEKRQRLFRTMSATRAYEESRAMMTTQVGAYGGFTVAPLFNANIESALLYYGPMLQVCEILRTATGADLPFITDNETTKTGSYVGENTAITTAETIANSMTVLKSYDATTNAILIPYNLFRDSAINLNSYISTKFGERLGRFINTESTTGAIKARGLMSRTTSGKTTASSTAITMDEVIALKYSVDKAYRTGAAWMFHDSVALALRLLKNGVGNYIWTDGGINGQPDRLDGDPVFVNNDMASSIASGAKTMAYGQLSKQKIRMIEEIRISQTDQRYWEYNQIGFAAYISFDSDLIDAGTHPVKHMTQV